MTTLALAAVALAGCQSTQETVAPNTLMASKVGTAPNPSALAADPAWAAARPLTFKLSDGANFAGGKGETTATLKAVYTSDMLYMLVQYQDPTNSMRRAPFQKQADGSWKALREAQNKGGDENTYYEDKWAFLWPVGTVRNFDKQGCTVSCHLGEGAVS